MARGRIFTQRLEDTRAAQRRALLDDLEGVFADQQARIVSGFALDDALREEQRWATGAWNGRTGLELEENRK